MQITFTFTMKQAEVLAQVVADGVVWTHDMQDQTERFLLSSLEVLVAQGKVHPEGTKELVISLELQDRKV